MVWDSRQSKGSLEPVVCKAMQLGSVRRGLWGMMADMGAEMGSEQAVESHSDKPLPGTGLTVCMLPCCRLCYALHTCRRCHCQRGH